MTGVNPVSTEVPTPAPATTTGSQHVDHSYPQTTPVDTRDSYDNTASGESQAGDPFSGELRSGVQPEGTTSESISQFVGQPAENPVVPQVVTPPVAPPATTQPNPSTFGAPPVTSGGYEARQATPPPPPVAPSASPGGFDQMSTPSVPARNVEVDPESDEADPDAPLVVADAGVPLDLPRRPLPRVIAIANQKGGVGKTTTTVNLGAALAEDDHRTLVIDLDPQGNATTGLGIDSHILEYSIYDVLLAEVPLEDCVESTAVRNLFIAPASLDLAGAEIELVPAMSRELRLRNAINRVRDDYDYILIDCPPSLGLLTVNALAAADEVMVPIQCEYYALEGLGQLIRNINLVQKNLNTALELSSIVLVMYDGRTKLAEQVSTEVRDHFGSVVCRNVIPRNIRLSEAPSYGQPITTFDPSSRGAVAYRELAREVHRVSS